MRKESFPPKADRRKDPKAWECLSDSQREQIAEWYETVSADDEEEKKVKARQEPWQWACGTLPFAVFFAQKHMSEPIWRYAFWFFANWAIILFVYGLGANIMENACDHHFTIGQKVLVFIGVFLFTAFFLSKIQ